MDLSLSMVVGMGGMGRRRRMLTGSLLSAACLTALATPSQAQVPYARLVGAANEPGAWLHYSGSYDGQRFSTLDQIDRGNASTLRPIWMYQIPGRVSIETTPIVADGVMYVTSNPSNVTALDVQTGRPIWAYERPMPRTLKTIGFPPVNRGVAILDDMVYVATLDGHLIALDARTGAVRWDTAIADNELGYAFTLAPLAIDGKIVVGTSGGEAGIRGWIDAYDAKTGDRAWRFWTIPGEGEPGNETWGGDSWKTGAGATWLTGSYDPDLNLLYWGVGNPGPDWNGDVRPGDNLYTSSVVALDADSGELRWHFQFTPHDTHDWDANQIQVLIDGEVGGVQRKLLVTANRNAFYYVLDRETGEFLDGRAYAHQTWAEGLDENGRPIEIPGMEPSEEGTLVYPSLQGSTNWFSPAYSPNSGLFYVAVREMGAIYYKSEVEYEPGEPFMGGGERPLDGDEASGSIRALDALTGERRWDFDLLTPPWTGLLATGGGLVFGGSNEGNVYALDAETGEARWEFQAGGGVRAGPMTYQDRGQQRVVFAAGQTIIAFGVAN